MIGYLAILALTLAQHINVSFFAIHSPFAVSLQPNIVRWFADSVKDNHRGAYPLALPSVFRYFPPAVAKVYIVSFRTHDDRRPSKFIVLADNMKSAIKMAWEHGGADFQSRFDKATAQAQEMKERGYAFGDG